MKCLWALMLVFTAPCTSVQWSSNEETALDALIMDVLSCFNIPGLSLALVKNGRIILAKGYGVKDELSREPVKNTTLFDIGSLTKAFAATLLSKELYGMGLHLDTPLTSVEGLRDLKFSTEELTSHVTARDLLSHRTGILNYDKARLNGEITLDNLAEHLPDFEAGYPLRSKFLYNNLMYGLVGHVTQRLTGKRWADALQDELLTPLRMLNTAVLNSTNYEQFHLPTPYDFPDDTPYEPRQISTDVLKLWSMNPPSMAIVSDAIDMGKWLLFQLNKGKAEGGLQVVSKKALAEVYRPVILSFHPRNKLTVRPTTPVTLLFEEYGCAWKSGHYRGYPIVAHTGSTHGFSSILSFIPSKQSGIYLNFNAMDRPHLRRHVLMAHLLDVVLEEKPWLNSSTICTFPAPFAQWQHTPKSGVNKTPGTGTRPLNNYAGQYHHPVFGTVTVAHNDTEPFLRMFYGPLGQWVLHPNKSDEFYGEGEGAVWNFDLWGLKFSSQDKNSGEIDVFVITSFEERKPPVFLKVTGKQTTSVSDVGFLSYLILFLFTLLARYKLKKLIRT
ncbi:uncharacterized protein LOC106151174 [Lingula anatina]|uniref:Uncharacterized protein LOC106151174 n=1 Tax=Lingula anatina TaxID=7574 RepID=A0A1S3H187_LINAN|nr:uncharacterized protein LOC106151174 [Lingula anatina]|eukprot:XP_013379773.1 uncharacterized protein LOC106151174 [Lingula anatina]